MKIQLILLQFLFVIFLNIFGDTEGKLSLTLSQEYVKYHGYNALFKLYMDEKTWDKARNRCILDGGDLAVVDTREKLEHVRKIIASRGECVFVGIHKPIALQEWIRVDNGFPVLSELWSVTSENYDFWRCGMATPVQDVLLQWNCEAPEKSLCEIPISEAINIVNPALSFLTLPEGYFIQRYRNRAYKLYTDEKTWDEARDRCMMDGGHLAIIDTHEKIEDLKVSIPEIGYSFVGFQKPAYAHKWIRIDSGLPVEFLPWIDSDYEDLNRRNCATMQYFKNGLIKENCESRSFSLCEVPIIEDEIEEDTIR